MNALNMDHNILPLTFFLLVIVIMSISFPGYCLIAPLIPPLSPHSPFYNQVFKANNIPTTTRHITLDENHYMTWLLSNIPSKSINEISPGYLQEFTRIFVMEMYMGDPLQTVQGIFDTGSSFIWFQCNTRQKTLYPFFNESISATYKPIDCRDFTKCNTTTQDIKGCNTLGNYCVFKTEYMDGDYALGVVATESISFKPEKKEMVLNFKFGCSYKNSNVFMGTIGAGNNDYSLPNQIYPYDSRFSYCIPSRLNITSFVKIGPDAQLSGYAINMMRNKHNPYYYINLFGITMNGERIDMDPSIFQMSEDGKRGIIIDFGSTFTYLTPVAFDALKVKLERLLGPAVSYNPFEICYTFGFKGTFKPWTKRPDIGIEIGENINFEFARDRTWRQMPKSNMECLLVLRETDASISILGNEQLLDVNVGYDPKTNHLFLDRSFSCPTL